MTSSEAHSGKFTVMRYGDRRLAILCPAGHVLASIAADEWAHSSWEARTEPVTCRGAL